VHAIIVCIVLCYTTISHAQTLNLYDAVNKTLDNYPLIKQREAQLAASKAHITTVNGERLPSLKLMDEVTYGISNSLPGSYFTMGTIPSSSSSIFKTENGSPSTGTIAISYLDWPVYTFGYLNAKTGEAKANMATRQSALNSDKYQLTGNIISLYLDWLKKYRLLQVEIENLSRSETILNAIRANVKSGLKPGVDSSTAVATYAHDRMGYLQASNNYQNDLITIATYTNSGTTHIEPDTTIISNGILDVGTQLQTVDSINTDHPILNYYQKQYEQQVASNKAIARSYAPKLSVEGAGWLRGSSISPFEKYSNDLITGFSYSRSNYMFGAVLSINLFDIRHRYDRVREGEYEAAARQYALQTQQIGLNQLLQQTNSAYAMEQEKLREFPAELKAARDAYNQQSALYKAGLNTLIDVTNALYVLKQTETDYVLAQDELLQLLYQKAALSNQTNIFLEKFKR